ncbi:glutamate-5-semialdehyde dehydrogenase [Pillotina sp. SPG140]|jgi:glutamate-5-semialdehyde dehydrogenase
MNTCVFESLRSSQKILAQQPRSEKDKALCAVAAAIDRSREAILSANKQDEQKLQAAGVQEALVDRLRLNNARIDSIIDQIKIIAALEDPLGDVQAGWTLANGLFIEQVTVPLGVVAIIYESRPNVTVDAFALAYKAGCAILLRGSSSALESNRALVQAIHCGLNDVHAITGAVNLADAGTHAEVDEILNARGYIDVVLPRGSAQLIRHVVEHARIPVIETGAGNCHIYVDESAELESALNIIENAKIQKPGACNAVETVLIHRAISDLCIPRLAQRLAGKVALRCDSHSYALLSSQHIPALNCTVATEADWETEFLDYILAVKVVHSVDEAIDHINRYGTQHSEAILTNNMSAAQKFCHCVDAACVYVNASTRFTDGGVFGFGAELGISTQKFHVRGPMGLSALTTTKYRITGTGQIRN